MAIFCLATDLNDLKRRIGNIVIGYTREREPVTARQLSGDGAMAVLLKDALLPNLVQTLENNPVFVHGGPFANIAHGCNSVLATQTALRLCDYVVTEAGFGADLGAEKFFDIKCRKAGLQPSAAVIVATVRALKMHGGVAKDDLKREDVQAVSLAPDNVVRRIVTDAELQAVIQAAQDAGTQAFVCNHWAEGSAGIEALARHVVAVADSGQANFKPLYPDAMPLWEKVRTIATDIYGASDITADGPARKRFAELQADYGHLPVCMAKTQYSFSTDPTLLGAPSGHVVAIRELRLSAGAEFIVVITGDIMTMPGLPKVPSANSIRLNEMGRIEGLF